MICSDPRDGCVWWGLKLGFLVSGDRGGDGGALSGFGVGIGCGPNLLWGG